MLQIIIIVKHSFYQKHYNNDFPTASVSLPTMRSQFCFGFSSTPPLDDTMTNHLRDHVYNACRSK